MRPPVTLRALVACLVAVAGLSACGEATDAEKRLRAALRDTERLSHLFIYEENFTDSTGETKTTVRGLVEDDFRYKARVAIDGRPVLDEVVSDDALAVRLVEPSRLAGFLRQPRQRDRGGAGVGASDAQETPVVRDAGGPDPVAALRSRRWVLDAAGAPDVLATGGDRLPGQDPLLDVRDLFAYVERAIDEATRVVEFNEESLEYRPREDPFPKPETGSGVIRYDFLRPDLPRAADVAPGGNQVVPDTRHFRKMSVYVKDGLVVQIREDIDVEARLEDLAEVYDTRFPEDLDPAEVAAIAVEALNAIRTGQGQDPIRMRTMTYLLKDLGEEVKVDMPTEVVEAPLALLQNRGRPADAAAGTALAAAVRSEPAGVPPPAAASEPAGVPPPAG